MTYGPMAYAYAYGPTLYSTTCLQDFDDFDY